MTLHCSPRSLRRSAGKVATAVVLAVAIGWPLAAAEPKTPPASVPVAAPEAKLIEGLAWRSIGPYRGGRVTAVAGVAGQPQRLLLRLDRRRRLEDDRRRRRAGPTSPTASSRRGSVGALAVAPSDPNVIYVGMGETLHPRQRLARRRRLPVDRRRQDLDARRPAPTRGRSAASASTRTNPDLVYVAALGHACGPNAERGVFRSQGRRQDLEEGPVRATTRPAPSTSRIDPTNPRILYAAFWEARRTPWSCRSGGPGSGLCKSTDGGDTWTEISTATGPAEGRRGARSASRSRPRRRDRVWAIVEAEDGGVFRSDDGGATWQRHERGPQPAPARLVLHATSTPTRRTPTPSTC